MCLPRPFALFARAFCIFLLPFTSWLFCSSAFCKPFSSSNSFSFCNLSFSFCSASHCSNARSVKLCIHASSAQSVSECLQREYLLLSQFSDQDSMQSISSSTCSYRIVLIQLAVLHRVHTDLHRRGNKSSADGLPSVGLASTIGSPRSILS